MALAALGSCHVTSSRQGVNENLQFSRFVGHIYREFSIFFHVIYLVGRPYRVLAANIKKLRISAPNTLSGENLLGETFSGKTIRRAKFSSPSQQFVTFARQKGSPKKIFHFSYHQLTMDYNSNNTRSKNTQILLILAKMTA